MNQMNVSLQIWEGPGRRPGPGQSPGPISSFRGLVHQLEPFQAPSKSFRQLSLPLPLPLLARQVSYPGEHVEEEGEGKVEV